MQGAFLLEKNMSGRQIKGITIEIDGNTTKLGKALQDVEKRSRETSSALKDIEKSLKFNPGNAELVTQQQNNLQKALNETKEKLEILKEADKQAKAQLDSGKMGQAEYDSLQREIIETEGNLKSYERRLKASQDEEEALSKAANSLTKIFEASGTSIDDYADIIGKDVVEAYKKGEGSSEQMWINSDYLQMI